MKMTKEIIEYIRQQQWDVELLSRECEVPIDKLNGTSDEALTAEELLRLCQKMNIAPEQIWSRL